MLVAGCPIPPPPAKTGVTLSPHPLNTAQSRCWGCPPLIHKMLHDSGEAVDERWTSFRPTPAPETPQV
jgi:hypothetical protein